MIITPNCKKPRKEQTLFQAWESNKSISSHKVKKQKLQSTPTNAPKKITSSVNTCSPSSDETATCSVKPGDVDALFSQSSSLLSEEDVSQRLDEIVGTGRQVADHTHMSLQNSELVLQNSSNSNCQIKVDFQGKREDASCFGELDTSTKPLSEIKPRNVETPRSSSQDVLPSNEVTDASPNQVFLFKAYAPSQLISEYIECGYGHVFQCIKSEFDVKQNDDSESYWRDSYSDRPGVTRWHPSALKRNRKNGKIIGSVCMDDNTQYRSRISFQGVFLNLGNHHSSASAAAAVDIASLLLWGSEDPKPMQILSMMEAWTALKAVGVPGIRPGGKIDTFNTLMTASEKEKVEKIVEEALSSIGGQDDTLASFLSSINTNAHKTAQNYDKKKKKAAEIYDKLENTRQLEVKKQEKKEKARAVKQASIMQRKEKDIFAKIKEEKEKEIMPLFNGQHGLFDFNFNDGTYSWRVPKESDLQTETF